MSEKIALIGSGGTIGMVPNEKGVLVPAQSAEELVAQAPSLEKLDVDLDVVQLLHKDSTNINIDDWKMIIQAIADRHADYDGIVVTHGTDTMANTASAAAFALGDELSIPVIFTGAQLPISEPGTDARVNLERAVRVTKEASKQGLSETMIVFNDRVLRAARSMKMSESRFDAFDSPAYPHLADITAAHELAFSPAVRTKTNMGFSITPRMNFASGVFATEANPNVDPDIVLAAALSPKCGALVLRSLGAGNVPSEGANSFLPVIEQTLEAGKPVILTSEFVGGKTIPEMYEPGMAALESGAGHAGNMTPVAAEVKLMWLMGQGITEPEKVSRAMLKPYVGEVD